jgi:hypothetical protein
VLNGRARRFERQLDRLSNEAATPERKIAIIFDWYERWFQAADFHGCLFAHALAEFADPGHPVFSAVAEQKNGLKSRMQRILEDAMPAKQAEAAALALLMLLEGATLMAQMGQGDAAINAARKAASSLVANPAMPQ